MSHSSHRVRRAAALAALSAVASLGAVASPAFAGPTLTLKYLCTYPLVGEQPLTVVISSNIPATLPAGNTTQAFNITAHATAGGDTRTGLKLVKAASIEGVTNSTAQFTGPEADLGVNVPIPVPKTTINAADTGDVIIDAAGSTPALTLRKQGVSKITLKTIALNLIARKADGTPITGLAAAQEIPATDPDSNTFDVSCRLDPAAGTQNLVIGTITVGAPTDSTPPTVPGVPVAGTPITSSTIPLSWAAATDNKAVTRYDVYDGDERVASTSGSTSVTVTSLASSQVHNFTVRARDASGNTGPASPVLTLSTTPEAKPTGTPVFTPLAPKTLTYSCQYPLVGNQSLSVAITTNIPTQVYAGQKLPAFNIQTVATTGAATWDALSLVGATSIEGDAIADSVIRAPGFSLPLGVPVSLEKTAVPTTRGPITLNALGKTPPITLPKPGSAKIAVDDLELNLTARRADGTAIRLPSIGTDSDGDPDTFDVICAVSPATNIALLGTIKLLVDSIAPSTPTGVTASSVTASSARLAWTASTDNASVSGYDVTYNGVTRSTTGPTAATTLTGLTPNTTYTVTVTAKDPSANKSTPSTAITFKTAAA